MRATFFLGTFLALIACGCGPKVTEIVVHVDTDLPAANIPTLHLVVGRVGAIPVVANDFPIDDTHPLPADIAIVPADDDVVNPLRIEVRAVGSPGTYSFNTSFDAHFTAGHVTVLRVHISNHCVNPMQDCGSGRSCNGDACVSNNVDPLPDYAP